jgi:hypothetical protein
MFSFLDIKNKYKKILINFRYIALNKKLKLNLIGRMNDVNGYFKYRLIIKI